jgi:predicted amidophosphoribosyltransferase
MDTKAVFEQNAHFLRPVPQESLSNVCYLCLGAAGADYQQCADCWKIFHAEGSCPASLRRMVVPMTVAMNPGPWYSILQTYKKGQFRENADVVASIAYEWLKRHRSHVAAMLGGSIEVITIVPSKRGYSYVAQPFRRALVKLGAFERRLTETLRCDHPERYDRMKYAPAIFTVVDASKIRGRRVLLLEDTWISGATAVSAAGALLDAGAKTVAITPLAREISPAFHAANTTYLAYLKRSYSIDVWPREVR